MKKVAFKSEGLTLAGNLFVPDSYQMVLNYLQ
jgi:hypothetical protein